MTAPVVVIMAAGEGTRMRSETPKLLHEICGRPMIAWPVSAALEAGAGKVVVVDSPARPLADVVDGMDSGGKVVLAIQERPLGTGDAVKSAAGEFAGAGTVIVLNGDHPLVTPETLRGLAAAHAASGAAATLATAVLEDPSGYGRVVRDGDGSVARVVETKAPGDASEQELQIREINTGIYAFEASALLSALDDVGSDNAQGEVYLPGVVPVLRARGQGVRAHVIADSAELGINDRVGLAAVRAVAQRRIHERHMRAGVTIVDPACTVIDAAVEIEADAVIAPFSSLHGATQVARGARVGPLSTLIDTEIGEGASIVHSYAQGARLGAGVSVGPFAYLRPGAVLSERSKVGTFVEVKNSNVGPGTKIPHLSYIGDADIGEGTNIGAGTITANYDGTHKNRTTIGDGVFVGVDNALIAPVTLHDRAYTAAGSVITKDVPAEALGVARARQTNVEGYVERRRAQADAERAAAEPARTPAESDHAPAEPDHAPAEPNPAPAEPSTRPPNLSTRPPNPSRRAIDG